MLALSLTLCAGHAFSGGDGTQGNPWLISTPQELASLSQYTAATGADKYFALANDITFSEADFSAEGDFYNEGKLWAPIGPTENEPFKGNLDGQNFTINGLKLNRDSDSFAGLFGVIEESTICNLTINYASAVASNWRSAGVAGIAKGATASNITINADISIKTKAYGGERAGGIFGSTTGDIRVENCQVTGTIKGDNPMRGILGGIIGSNSDFVEISYCDVEADITNVESAGGIIGKDSAGAQLTGCQFSGSMFGNYYFGGMIGDASYVRDDYTIFSNVFENCSVHADISANAPDNFGSSYVGGLLGYSAGRQLTFNNCTYAGNLQATAPSGEACIGGMVGVGTRCFTRLEKCRSAGTIYGQVRGTGSSWMGMDTVYAGGIAGYLSAYSRAGGPLSVKSCYASMDITGNSVANIYVGGLLGAIIGTDYAAAQLDDVVIGCGSDGKVAIKSTGASSYFLGAGGLVGRLEKIELSDCYALNHIVATSSASYSLGSLVATATSSSIKHSHALGDLEAADGSNKTGTLGGILGKNVGSTVSQCVALPHLLQGIYNAEVPAPLIYRVVSGEHTGLTQNLARGEMVKLMGDTVIGSADDLNGPDGLGISDREIEQQGTYENLGWDFRTTWYMSEEGYPLLTWNLPEPEAPTIVEHPQSVTAMEGDSVTFTVVATGTEPLNYDWYWNGNHLVDYSGPSLTLESVSPNHAGEYIVHVNNQYGRAISEAAILTVIVPEPPTIVEQPHSLQVFLGQSATFSVTATGTEPLSYQWNKDAQPISGANSTSYTIANVTLDDAGVYTVLVTNNYGEEISHRAVLTVVEPVPPSIVEQPMSILALVGEDAQFEVIAKGTAPLTYQWFKNGSPIQGATEPAYFIESVTMNDVGLFTVQVSNEFGSVVSDVVQLSVYEPAAPTIVLQPEALTVELGQSATFSVRVTGTEPITYQWFKDGDPIRGANEPTYTITYVEEHHEGSYSIQASNRYGEEMSDLAELVITYRPAPPVITTQPQTLIVGSGSAATFAVVARGNNLTYQWYFENEEIEGATDPVYVISKTTEADSGIYTVQVSNEGGMVMSDPASLWLNHLLMYAGINVFGPVGAEFLVEYTLTPGDPQSWKELRWGVITSLPTVVIDYDSPQDAKRFYRVIANDNIEIEF